MPALLKLAVVIVLIVTVLGTGGAVLLGNSSGAAYGGVLIFVFVGLLCFAALWNHIKSSWGDDDA